MVNAWPPALHKGPDAVCAETIPETTLVNIVYRSRAVTPLSALELHRLTLAAQARNRAESVTGLLLYDSERFFQWLEGPADNLDRIMRCIRDDTRHADIEILLEKPVDTRRFGGWGMRLAMLGTGPFAWPPEAIKAPRDIVERLRQRPEDAPGLLVKLGPAPAVQEVPRMPLDLQAASILEDVIRGTVIPALADEHGSPDPDFCHPQVHTHVQELAGLLIASDPTAAFELIAALRASEKLLLPLYASLVEPVARSLGDLWSDDACSEFDVTLGLCRLQTAVRRLSTSPASASIQRSRMPTVLIAPEPGEIHRLGAALDSEVLWHAGWAPHSAYPASDQALQELVATTWFDALDLSLSSAFRREHWLPRLTDTIALARLASRNPALVVVVGGRVFRDGNTGAGTGADAASRTSLHIDHSILEAIRATRNSRSRLN